ncbi:hypothetical protein OIO90_003698 [Microbotryomycetes sp. JL221]|nr:hypothetical protein OIO90_003698 [Microbotryomycetes sp. JL221]
MRQFKVAAAQLDAVYYDAQANLGKIKLAIEQAANAGAKLVVFAELALSGYPFHVWTLPYHEQLPFVKRFYTEGAVEADGPEMHMLQETVVKHQINAVVGFSERDGGSLFMSQWILTSDGQVKVRRKLKPTSLERIVYGEGDGSDLKVHDTELGRLGVLQCWEHAQPLIKVAMSSQHEELHAASWPVFPSALPHFSLSKEANWAILTTYAIETGTFVVSASSLFSKQNIDVLSANGTRDCPLELGAGWSTIIDPEGRTLASSEPGQVGLIYADIDLDDCYEAKSVLDPTGHYSRRDVFQVGPHMEIHKKPTAKSEARKSSFDEDQGVLINA